MAETSKSSEFLMNRMFLTPRSREALRKERALDELVAVLAGDEDGLRRAVVEHEFTPQGVLRFGDFLDLFEKALKTTGM